MPTLLLRREQDGAGVFRKMKVTLDGEVVARLRPGAQVEVDVPPGPHGVQARMDWASSEVVQVTSDGDSRHCVAVGYRLSSFYATFFRPGTAIDIQLKAL